MSTQRLTLGSSAGRVPSGPSTMGQMDLRPRPFSPARWRNTLEVTDHGRFRR